MTTYPFTKHLSLEEIAELLRVWMGESFLLSHTFSNLANVRYLAKYQDFIYDMQEAALDDKGDGAPLSKANVLKLLKILSKDDVNKITFEYMKMGVSAWKSDSDTGTYWFRPVIPILRKLQAADPSMFKLDRKYTAVFRGTWLDVEKKVGRLINKSRYWKFVNVAGYKMAILTIPVTYKPQNSLESCTVDPQTAFKFGAGQISVIMRRNDDFLFSPDTITKFTTLYSYEKETIRIGGKPIKVFLAISYDDYFMLKGRDDMFAAVGDKYRTKVPRVAKSKVASLVPLKKIPVRAK